MLGQVRAALGVLIGDHSAVELDQLLVSMGREPADGVVVRDARQLVRFHELVLELQGVADPSAQEELVLEALEEDVAAVMRLAHPDTG